VTGDASQAVVRARRLAKHYGPVRAVDGVDLKVDRGDIYALLGLNGAGKTTTIRMLLAMIAPTAGEVQLFGQQATVAAQQVWGRTGYLVESPAAYRELTVRRNLEVAARLKRLPARASGPVIERLGLQPYATRKAGTLSLGNLQRLGLARALLGDPGLLVLDEPANGLDPAGVSEIRQLLKDLAAQGTAILLSSHILAEVAKLATRIGIIHEGRMVTELDADALPQRVRRELQVVCHDAAAATKALLEAGFTVRRREGGLLTLTDPRAVAAPDRVAVLLVRADCPPTHLAVHEEDLESMFLRLTGQEARR
jgi:ABC-2 type transport system ATP-binding protein